MKSTLKMQAKVSTTHTMQPAPVDEGAALARSTAEGGKMSRIKNFVSTVLFEGANEVAITHQDETYFLRITKQNKLILTK